MRKHCLWLIVIKYFLSNLASFLFASRDESIRSFGSRSAAVAAAAAPPSKNDQLLLGPDLAFGSNTYRIPKTTREGPSGRESPPSFPGPRRIQAADGPLLPIVQDGLVFTVDLLISGPGGTGALFDRQIEIDEVRIRLRIDRRGDIDDRSR